MDITPSPLIAIDNEPDPILAVDEPLAGPLASGKVFIQYRASNVRIMPVFGLGAMRVSPRLGHMQLVPCNSPFQVEAAECWVARQFSYKAMMVGTLSLKYAESAAPSGRAS